MHLPSVSPRSRLSATTEKPPSGCSKRASIMRSPSSQAAENVAAVATYRKQSLSGNHQHDEGQGRKQEGRVSSGGRWM